MGTIADQLNTAMRDFNRYSGDGKPGEPVNRPLPQGDPASGEYNPTKKQVRDAFLALADSADGLAGAVSSTADNVLAAQDFADASEISNLSSTAAAASSLTYRDQAQVAALAAGAPLVTTLTDPVPANGTIEILQTSAGGQVWQVVTGAWSIVGWLTMPTYSTIAEMALATGLIDGQGVSVSDAFNGEPEKFTYASTSTLTADGALIVTPTGMVAGRLISTRTFYANWLEFDADVRPLDIGLSLTVRGAGGFTIVASGEHFTTTGGLKVTIDDALPTPQHYGSNGSLARNDAAFTALLANHKDIRIPWRVANYQLTAGLHNFARQDRVIEMDGLPVLQFNGVGRGFVADDGRADGNVTGEMHVGSFRVIGSAACTDLFYTRGIVRSNFGDIEVAEATAAAFRILHGVANVYGQLKWSENVRTHTTKPAKGLMLDENGVGYYTANCEFNSIVIEGDVDIGVDLLAASGNKLISGTSEGGVKAAPIRIAAGCARNEFDSFWCEGNVIRDLEDSGEANKYNNCYFGSNGVSGNNVEMVTSQGAMFTGGFIRVVNLQATSKDTLFVGVGFSDNAALGIKGTGAYKSLGCYETDINGDITASLDDVFGSEGPFVPTISGSTGDPTVTYGTRGGYWWRVGKLIHFTVNLTITAISGGSGDVSISGIPVPPVQKTSVQIGDYGQVSLAGGRLQLVGAINPGSTAIGLRGAGYLSAIDSNVGTSSAAVTVAALGATFSIEVSGMYAVA